MLSEKEKHFISELLTLLDVRDLASLAQTVTSRLIMPETATEAVSAILLHTDRPVDLLRRRKVKRDLLFKYLNDKRVAVNPSADKSVLVSAVLQLWGCAPLPSISSTSSLLSASASAVCLLTAAATEEESLPEAPAPSRNTSYSSLCNLDFGAQLNLGLGGLNSLPLNMESSSSSPQLSRRRRPTAPMTPPPLMPTSLRSMISRSNESMDNMEDDSNGPIELRIPKPPADIEPCPGQEHANDMADSFVKWFYPLINSTFYYPDTHEFGPQHFWVDASARISLQECPSSGVGLPLMPDGGINTTNNSSHLISVRESAEQVSAALRDIVRRYRVTYNPNLSRDGVSGFIDVHGLAIVTACGTLHNPATSRCCGTFHQQFGLIRDPDFGNNWKIKYTNASLISKDSVNEIPRLASWTATSSAMAFS